MKNEPDISPAHKADVGVGVESMGADSTASYAYTSKKEDEVIQRE